jgi:hypothetical protein
MSSSVRLAPIRRGYPYGVRVNFPPDSLAEGETLRAQLRRRPSGPLVATFAVERDGDSVELTLTESQTESLGRVLHVTAFTLVLDGGAETPLKRRYHILVEDHPTRPLP